VSDEHASWRIICLGALAALAALSGLVYAGGPMPLDGAVRDAVLEHASPLVRAVAHWVNYAGGWQVLLPGMLVLFALSPDGRRSWWLWALVLPFAAMLEGALKDVVGRTRPESPAMGFPSGHVTAIAAFAVMVVYLVGRSRLGARGRRLAVPAALLLIVAVGVARIVLRAHWPSDVLGGLALGVTVAAAAAWGHAVWLAGGSPSRPGGGASSSPPGVRAS
jgi:membrane-associated phospholipid phosphatase